MPLTYVLSALVGIGSYQSKRPNLQNKLPNHPIFKGLKHCFWHLDRFKVVVILKQCSRDAILPLRLVEKRKALDIEEIERGKTQPSRIMLYSNYSEYTLYLVHGRWPTPLNNAGASDVISASHLYSLLIRKDFLYPSDPAVLQPHFDPARMEGGRSKDILYNPDRSAAGSLVFFQDDCDALSGSNVTAILAVHNVPYTLPSPAYWHA